MIKFLDLVLYDVLEAFNIVVITCWLNITIILKVILINRDVITAINKTSYC